MDTLLSYFPWSFVLVYIDDINHIQLYYRKRISQTCTRGAGSVVLSLLPLLMARSYNVKNMGCVPCRALMYVVYCFCNFLMACVAMLAVSQVVRLKE